MNDSHAHLTTPPISENLDSILKDFLDRGGKHILNVAYDPESMNSVLQQFNKYQGMYPGLILNAIGIHPEHFSENYDSNGLTLFEKTKKLLDSFENILEQSKDRIHAVGETGLDYFHIFRDTSLTSQERDEIMEVQRNSFRKHAQLALQYNLPLTIHTRDLAEKDMATVDALEILAEVGKGRLKGSFHSYTGKLDHVNEIVSLGFHIGFNAIITYPSGASVHEILKATPEERILFETDSPLLPAQSVRSDRKRKDKFGKPSDIEEIIQTAAKIKGSTYDRLLKISDENFSNLFLSN